MFNEEFFKEFDENLILKEWSPYWNWKNEKHYSVKYFHEKEKIAFTLTILFEDYKVKVCSESFFLADKTENKQLTIYYAKKMKEYLKNHPKFRMRFLYERKQVDFSDLLFPFVHKKSFSLYDWFLRGKNYKEFFGLFFLLYSISMIGLLIIGVKEHGNSIPLIVFCDFLLSSIIYSLHFILLKLRFDRKYSLKI